MRLKTYSRSIQAVNCSARWLHTLPSLNIGIDSKYSIQDPSEILPLFSKAAFEIAWTKYQSLLISQLNSQVKGTANEDASILKTILRTYRQSSFVPTFNYACQAHNNHFFFNQLLPNEFQEDIPETLRQAIENQWGSIDRFRDEFLDTAESLFGNGWVWLVLDSELQLRIVATYNAGTPYVWDRRQTLDSNTAIDSIDFIAKKNFSLIPILNLCCWQHCYLSQYGIDGRKQYLKNWWKCINWERVYEIFIRAKDPLDPTIVKE